MMKERERADEEGRESKVVRQVDKEEIVGARVEGEGEIVFIEFVVKRGWLQTP
jgi:hypothetical protein